VIVNFSESSIFHFPRPFLPQIKSKKQQTTNNKNQPTTNNKQQTTNNKQQTTNNKQQTTNNKQQTTNQTFSSIPLFRDCDWLFEPSGLSLEEVRFESTLTIAFNQLTLQGSHNGSEGKGGAKISPQAEFERPAFNQIILVFPSAVFICLKKERKKRKEKKRKTSNNQTF
jgi:hypothetical protein